MKQIATLVVILASMGGYVWWSNTSTSASSATPPSTATNQPSGKYKNGTYHGTVSQTIYGPVGVSAVIAGGAITDIIIDQMPSDPGFTTELNKKTMPILKMDAIAKQGANVDSVTGATQSVDGFKESLASALQNATL